jgi:solute carrier family 25 citrate transporter 1
MQSLRAKQEYRNALHCAYRIATEEGVLKFWKGTVPRLGRLIVSLRDIQVPCRADGS